MYDRAVAGREAVWVLAKLQQGNQTVTDYSIEFCTLAAECNWNMEAQWDIFLHGNLSFPGGEGETQDCVCTVVQRVTLLHSVR